MTRLPRETRGAPLADGVGESADAAGVAGEHERETLLRTRDVEMSPL